jgi:O-antigen/teichoic acid export membrane protein
LIKQIQHQYSGLRTYLKSNETFVWTFLDFAASNFFRLLSSLILTRIFLPDQFGLMAILISLYVGVELLSDIGIETSIIRHHDDKDSDFLKSAWTLCVIRGFVLCIVVLLTANFFSELFESDILKQYLLVFSFIFIIRGFKSTSLTLHTRNRKVKIVSKLELSNQVITLITILGLAAYFESLWAFIFGMMFSELLRTLSTYHFLKGGVTGFLLVKKHVYSMVKFGKWLFLATVLTFFGSQGDRFLLGIYLAKEDLGIYHLAATLAALPVMLHGSLSSKILFPSVCEKINLPVTEFNVFFVQLRQKVVLLSFPIAIVLAIFGQEIIALLYNSNYQNAGKMVQILSVGAMLQIIADSISPILNAKGDSFRHMLFTGFRASLFIASIVVGNYFFQFNGVLIAIAIAPFFSIILVSFLVRKYVKLSNIFSLVLIIISFSALILVIR